MSDSTTAIPTNAKNTNPTRSMKGSEGQASLKTKDRTAEAMAAANAPVAVQRDQNIPSRNMTQMPGVKNPVNSRMYWNAWAKLPSSGLARIMATINGTKGGMGPHNNRWD